MYPPTAAIHTVSRHRKDCILTCGKCSSILPPILIPGWKHRSLKSADALTIAFLRQQICWLKKAVVRRKRWKCIILLSDIALETGQLLVVETHWCNALHREYFQIEMVLISESGTHMWIELPRPLLLNHCRRRRVHCSWFCRMITVKSLPPKRSSWIKSHTRSKSTSHCWYRQTSISYILHILCAAYKNQWRRWRIWIRRYGFGDFTLALAWSVINGTRQWLLWASLVIVEGKQPSVYQFAAQTGLQLALCFMGLIVS